MRFVTAEFIGEKHEQNKAKCLIDCGASRNVLSLEFYSKFLRHLEIEPFEENVHGISGKAIESVGIIRALFYINKRPFVEEFLVLPGISHQILLGTPFLSNNKCVIDFEKERIVATKNGERLHIPMFNGGVLFKKKVHLFEKNNYSCKK